MLDVLATYRNAFSASWSETNPLIMEPYALNLSMAIGMKQIESRFVRIEGQSEVFKTPLIQVDLPNTEECSCIFISGEVQEILARVRG